MSRTSSTFGKPAGVRSSIRNYGAQNTKVMSSTKVKSKVSERIRAQSPSVMEWSKTLRSRSPSPTRVSTSTTNTLVTRSLSPTTLTKGMTTSKQGMTSSKPGMSTMTRSILRTTRSRSPSPHRLAFSTSNLKDLQVASRKKSTLSNSYSRNTAGSWASGVNLAGQASTTTNNEMATIETEYIKNLQQQIYFLELESNYLRDQAKKATDMHPKMTVEAERMMAKLRQLQGEIDGMHYEMKRKDSTLCVTQNEKERTEDILRNQEEVRQREKLVMTDEIITLKKGKDRLEFDSARKDNQLLEAKTEVDKSSTALRNAELKLTSLRNQLDQRTDQYTMTQMTLDEKRSALVQVETQLRDTEDQFYNSTMVVHEKVTTELRDDISYLRQKLKDLELSAEKDKFLKEKLDSENTMMSRENTSYTMRITDLQQHVDRERLLRESLEVRQRENISELICLREEEKRLRMELEQSEMRQKREQDKSQIFLEQLSKQENVSTSLEVQMNSTKLKLSDVESFNRSAEAENSQLRKDKILLVDHVADLQRQIEMKDHELMSLQSEVSALDTRFQDLDYQKTLESSVHSQKWHEFGRLAESMRTLSSTMARSVSPSQSQSKLVQY